MPPSPPLQVNRQVEVKQEEEESLCVWVGLAIYALPLIIFIFIFSLPLLFDALHLPPVGFQGNMPGVRGHCVGSGGGGRGGRRRQHPVETESEPVSQSERQNIALVAGGACQGTKGTSCDQLS